MTTEQFCDYLLEEYSKRATVSEADVLAIKRIISIGYIKDAGLERRNAAAIMHLFMRRTGIESDEDSWDKAKILKDLYDCRVCVDHVGQMYVKGIMASETPEVFGMRKILDEEEAEEIVTRLFDKSKRIKI